MPDKIIFLDIDGPMIPATHYLFEKHAGLNQKFSPTCVSVLEKILEASGAKIVINSTHSMSFHREGIVKEFEYWNLDSHLHPVEPHTSYPNNRDRLDAINQWLAENRTEQMLWVALDDCPIEHKRAFLVDFDHGLGLNAYNHCAQYLMYKPYIVLG